MLPPSSATPERSVFRELTHCVGDLAWELHAALQPSDELIAIVMEKSVEQIVAGARRP